MKFKKKTTRLNIDNNVRVKLENRLYNINNPNNLSL